MEPLVVRKEIVIDAPASRVWSYVATQEGYRRWSCTVAEVHELVLEEHEGGRYEERMMVGGKEYHLAGQVIRYEPPRQIVLSFRSRRTDGTYWPEPRIVTITLTESAGRTRVSVEESGFEELPDADRDRVYRSTDLGWSVAMEDLRTLLIREVMGAPEPLAVHKEIVINAPPERVWPHVATAEGCRQWFCPPADRFDMILEERPGGRFEEHYVARGTEFHTMGEVISYDPPRTLMLSYRPKGHDGSLWPVATIITITLTEEDGRTRVTLEHSGYERLPVEYREESFRRVDAGWEEAVQHLRALVAGEVAGQPLGGGAAWSR